MKKTALFLTIAAALLLAGCHSDIDDRITQLKQDVSELEIRVSRLNESLNSLSELVGALEKNDHITNISPLPLPAFVRRTGAVPSGCRRRPPVHPQP